MNCVTSTLSVAEQSVPKEHYFFIPTPSRHLHLSIGQEHGGETAFTPAVALATGRRVLLAGSRGQPGARRLRPVGSRSLGGVRDSAAGTHLFSSPTTRAELAAAAAASPARGRASAAAWRARVQQRRPSFLSCCFLCESKTDSSSFID